jgi:hypothetical protein
LFYRPVPAPGPGPIVDPLGEALNAGLPDGFRTLLAPAAILPAPVSIPPLVAFPVVVPGAVVPPTDDPVEVPLVVDPPVDVPVPVEPVPVCASANELANVSAAANPRLLSFMISPFQVRKEKRQQQAGGSCADFNWM